MKNFVNKSHISGFIYEHDLALKVTGAQSKAPNTQYITGTLSVATDDACLNIVPVHFSYVTAKTSTGKDNATFATLNSIIDGTHKTIMNGGKENAACVRIDSAIALNEFYTDKNRKEELVSAKRNEGGFVHVCSPSELEADENARNTFETDILITNATRTEADEEKNIPEKVILKGAIFDFRKALLPVEFAVYSEGGKDYFEGLGISAKEPLLTKVKGNQISETIVRQTVEEGAFGEPSVRETRSTRKEFVVNWAMSAPYDWDAEGTMTVAELNEAIANREVYLADMKRRADEYKASKNNAMAASTAPAAGGFNF